MQTIYSHQRHQRCRYLIHIPVPHAVPVLCAENTDSCLITTAINLPYLQRNAPPVLPPPCAAVCRSSSKNKNETQYSAVFIELFRVRCGLVVHVHNCSALGCPCSVCAVDACVCWVASGSAGFRDVLCAKCMIDDGVCIATCVCVCVLMYVCMPHGPQQRSAAVVAAHELTSPHPHREARLRHCAPAVP